MLIELRPNADLALSVKPGLYIANFLHWLLKRLCQNSAALNQLKFIYKIETIQNIKNKDIFQHKPIFSAKSVHKVC